MRKRYGDNLWDLLRILAAGAWSILVGLYITGINLIRPGVCERYPRRDHRPVYRPPGLRGDLALLSDPEARAGLRVSPACSARNRPLMCIH